MIDSVTGGYDISRRPGTPAGPAGYPGTARARRAAPSGRNSMKPGMHDLSHAREEGARERRYPVRSG